MQVHQPPPLVARCRSGFRGRWAEALPVVPARGDEIPVEFDDRRIAIDAGVDEGHLRAGGPESRSQLGIGAFHRRKVGGDLFR